MWTWERERRGQAREPEVQLGQVTIGGETAAVNLGGERRWLSVCAPGGYSWRPAPGDRVLVLKGEPGEGAWVLGKVEELDDLKPGELRLTGDVTVNGEGLEDYIRRVAAEILAGG